MSAELKFVHKCNVEAKEHAVDESEKHSRKFKTEEHQINNFHKK